MNWNDTLRVYHDDVINALCGTHHVAGLEQGVSLNNRARVVDLLRKQLGKPEHVRESLKQIGPVEAFAIKKLLAGGGTLKADEVKIAIQEAGIPLKVSVQDPTLITPNYAGIPRFEDAIARATTLGLIFSRDSQTAQPEIRWQPGRTLYMPDPVRHVFMMVRDIREILDNLLQKAVGKPDENTAPPFVITGAAVDFQRDLSRYWRHVRKIGKLNITTQGWVYKNTFKHVLTALNSPPDAAVEELTNWRLWFMRRLLTQLGDFVTPDRYMLDLSASEKPILPQLAMADRVRRVFELWRDEKVWNEWVLFTGQASDQEPTNVPPPELAKARAALLRVMARLSASNPTRWVPFGQLVESVRRTDYDWLFPRNYLGRDLRKGSSLYQSPYYYENNPYRITVQGVTNEEKGWNMVEPSFMATMLSYPLVWLGIIDVGFENKPKGERELPQAYRLTEVGAWLLGVAPQPKFIESGGRVIVQPNFTILAMEPIPDVVLLELDRFAEAKGGDRVLNYELNRQSVYRAQRSGSSVGEIIQFLEQQQGGPLASNVRRTLEEWELQHRRIVFHRNTAVLQFADADARDATQTILDAVPPSNLSQGRDQSFMVPLNSDFALVKKTLPANTIVSRLTESGWLPLTSKADNTDLTGSIRMDESGEFEFRQATPSIYTLALTERFATRKGRGGQITAASVRAAMGKGVSLDDMLTQLKTVQGGALSHKLETNIRSWAGFYGNASLKTVCLLELSSREVLDNLLKDRELGGFLKPIEGSSKPMAIVDAVHADQVAAVLRDRGVVV